MTQPLFITLVIALYFAVLMIVARLTSKGATNATYFTGNRNMAWPVVAIAMITAPISGLTFISVPGMIVTKGYSYLQMCLGFVAGYFLIALVLVPLFYKLKIISIYSFLQNRFGQSAYKTGAWLFLISEVLGIGVRFMVVCMVLQALVFEPLKLPFALNVAVTMALIWFYTARGGVKSVIWSDTLKSVILLSSVIVIFFVITSQLGIPAKEIPTTISEHYSSEIFNFYDIADPSYFWKQFLTGVFLVVAMTGLDQDMMQRILACKDSRGSQKNLVVSGITQFFVISLFLMLGTLMLLYMETRNIAIPTKTDDIFATVAFHSEMPFVVSLLFILGLISASYSSVGSALTSLTTSFTIDVMGAKDKFNEETLQQKRKKVHASMALIMGGVILVCYYLNDRDAISALFTLASYTYGPILGLFAFGLFSKRQIKSQYVPWVCLLSPLLSWIAAKALFLFFDYQAGYEIFLLNALFTIIGLSLTPSSVTSYDTDSQVLSA